MFDNSVSLDQSVIIVYSAIYPFQKSCFMAEIFEENR